MNQVYYFITLLSVLPVFLCAHEPDQAFFSITEKDKEVEVVAELPWSIRNALLLEYPNLEITKIQKEFDDAFKRYVESHLIIYDKRNQMLPLVYIEELPQETHAHASQYKFVYKGTNIDRIQNTILLALYAQHQNFHTILDDTSFTFVTQKGKTEFNLPKNESFEELLWSLIIIFALIPIWIIGRLKRNVVK